MRYEQGDHAAALAAVKPVAATSPFAARAQLRAGISQLESKDYATAAATLTRLVDPKVLQTTTPPPAHLGPVLNNLGIVQLRRGASADAGSATYYLTRATDADPEAADYQFNLGYAYLLDRNYKASLYWLREAVRREVTDADAHYLLALALQAEGSGVEAAREKDLARQLSSRYEEAERTVGRQDVPAGLERLRTDLELSQTVRTTQAISNSAQRGQLELATFHLDRGRQLFEQEQDREALLELKTSHLSLAVRSGRAPADRPHSPACRPPGRRRRGVEDLDLERGLGAGARRPRPGLPVDEELGGRAERAAEGARARPGVQRGPAAARHDQVERLRPPDPTRKGHRKFSRYQDVRAVHDAKERRSAW